MESRTSTEQSSLHLANEPDEIELILKPHPTKETSLSSKRFLKTTSNATSNFKKINLELVERLIAFRVFESFNLLSQMIFKLLFLGVPLAKRRNHI